MHIKTTMNVILIIVLIAAVTAVNWVWLLLPVKELDVVVLDKTVHAERIDRNNNLIGEYRKHFGFFWILDNQRYVKPGTKEIYDYRNDYYGPVLNRSDNTFTVRSLAMPSGTSDFLYLADGYGDESGTGLARGITDSDMDVISKMYNDGTRIVGEFNISADSTSAAVRAEIQNIFGIDFTGWSGRYVTDLEDRDGMEEWTRILFERQYGRTWDLSGPGLLLVSTQQELVILQEGIDYKEGSFWIKILPRYRDQFGNLAVNYYNWFEIITARADTEVIADYNIQLSDAGKAKASAIFSDGKAAAFTRRYYSSRYSCYFAGEFSDYTPSGDRYESVVAAKLNMLLSYDKKGDTVNFFWKFYVPVMSVLLDEAYENKPAA